jgi:hypothetical protein
MTDQQIIDLFFLLLHGSEDALDQARVKLKQAQDALDAAEGGGDDIDPNPGPQASTNA